MDESPSMRPTFDYSEWKTALLDRVLGAAAAGLGLALIFTLLDVGQMGRIAVGPSLAVSWAFLTVAAVARKLSGRIRSALAVAGLCVAFTSTLVKMGFQLPNPLAAALMSLVFVALVVGARAAWAAWAGLLLSLAFVAYLHATGIVEVAEPVLLDQGRALNWFRVLTIFALIAALTVVSATYVTRRLEATIAERDRLLSALMVESDRRLATIKESRRLEEQLREAQKMEALGTLAGGVAHDFNNVLTIIGTCASMAELQLEKHEAVAHNLAEIQRATKRGGMLTRKLLAFARKRVAEHTTLDVNEQLAALKELLVRLLPSSIELHFHPGPGVGQIRFAEVELDQILLNLCLNARDAMPDGGRITIATENAVHEAPSGRSRRGVLIRVADSGEGIATADRRRIFEPFFTTKGPEKGTGLGLSVVHGIIDEADGSIEVDSELGQGTEFRIWLPAAESAAEPSQAPPGSETILVVDDEDPVRQILAAVLQRAGYEVITAADGERGLSAFEREQDTIDLVVSDVMMPGLNGRQLFDAIEARRPGLPFVFCTGFASEVLETEFLKGARRALLQKPFRSRSLLLTVRALLDGEPPPAIVDEPRREDRAKLS